MENCNNKKPIVKMHYKFFDKYQPPDFIKIGKLDGDIVPNFDCYISKLLCAGYITFIYPVRCSLFTSQPKVYVRPVSSFAIAYR